MNQSIVFEVWRSTIDGSIRFDPQPTEEVEKEVLNNELIIKYLEGGSILTFSWDGQLKLIRIVDTSGAICKEGARNLIEEILKLNALHT